MCIRDSIYYADEEALWQVDGLKKEQAALLGSKSLAAADRILSDCARKDIFIITMADALYPDRLRNIYQPPLLLYGKGDVYKRQAVMSRAVSEDSPFGKALVGRKAGDAVIVEAPKGAINYRVDSLER